MTSSSGNERSMSIYRPPMVVALDVRAYDDSSGGRSAKGGENEILALCTCFVMEEVSVRDTYKLHTDNLQRCHLGYAS